MMWYERLLAIIEAETVDVFLKDPVYHNDKLSEMSLSSHQIINNYYEKALAPLQADDIAYQTINEKFENAEEIFPAYFSIEDEEIYQYTLNSIQLNKTLNDFFAIKNIMGFTEAQHSKCLAALTHNESIFLTVHDQYRKSLERFHDYLKVGEVNYTHVQRMISHYLYTLFKLFASQKNIFGIECKLIIYLMKHFSHVFDVKKSVNHKESFQLTHNLIRELKERGFHIPEDYLSNPHWNTAIQKELKEHLETLENECEVVGELAILLSNTMKKLKFPIIYQQ